jgi:hypothetical protein
METELPVSAAPAEPKDGFISVRESDIVDVSELSPEDLKTINDAEEASENPLDIKSTIVTFLGGAAGFIAFAYINKAILDYATAQGASGTVTAQLRSLLLYSAALLVAEIIVGALVMKHAAKAKGGESFLKAAGVGIMISGVASFANFAIAYFGGTAVPASAIPAVNFSGNPLLSRSRAVGV